MFEVVWEDESAGFPHLGHKAEGGEPLDGLTTIYGISGAYVFPEGVVAGVGARGGESEVAEAARELGGGRPGMI